MNQTHFEKMKNNKGFIAALDQSGGSTPKALAVYGIKEDQYESTEEMFNLVHEMRSRIITSPAFNPEHIIGAILFEQTMDRKIDGMYTADYLSAKKQIVPFLKVDRGLADEYNGSQLMKPIDDLAALLERANERNIFGTKMRSVIKGYHEITIKEVVKQQFEIGKQIINAGLVPIIEPEVDINAPDKQGIEGYMKTEILRELGELKPEQKIMLKLTIPTEANLFKELVAHPNVIRVAALSGGYTTADATRKLAKNDGVIASFSRALTQDLKVGQSQKEFDQTLTEAVRSIYNASL